MKKTVSVLVLSALVSSLAFASEETNYVTEQSAEHNGSSMLVRATAQVGLVEFISIHPVLGLLVYSATAASMQDLNVKDLDTLTYVKFKSLIKFIQDKLEVFFEKLSDASSKSSDATHAFDEATSDGTTKLAKAVDDVLQEAVLSFSKKVRQEKVAFYANGKVDVAQTPTLFGAANEVAQTKGVDINAAAAVIIANSEALLDSQNL